MAKLAAMPVQKTPPAEAHAAAPAAADVAALLHELQVHQAEIECQNDELRHVNVALETTRQRYQLLFENMPTASFTVGALGTVMECNRAAEALFGLSRRRLKGRPLLLLADAADHARFVRHVEVARSLGKTASAEFMFRRGDGSIFCGRFECSLFDLQIGEPTLLCTVFDISQAHRHEAELRAANTEVNHARDQVEAALAAKTRFLAAASHDLRQPAQAMNLYMDVLAGQLAADSPAAATLARLRESLESMSELLNGILDLSKLEAGLIAPKLAPVALQPLLERLGAEFGTLAADKGITLRTRFTRAVAFCDSLLLERILRNLLQNAVRYTAEGGIFVGVRARPEHLLIEVADTGIGIPDDQLLTIFEEFRQVSNQARNRAEGLGLGLAIVDRLVNLLGCRLDVRSRLGRGSRFVVEVPRALL